jgi:hypothetical protein
MPLWLISSANSTFVCVISEHQHIWGMQSHKDLILKIPVFQTGGCHSGINRNVVDNYFRIPALLWHSPS